MLNDDLTNPAQDDSSWISKVQPGPRLLLGAGGAMMTSFLDQPLPLGIVAVMTLAILTIRRVPLSWIWGRLLNLSWLLFAFALPLLWLGPGEGTWPLAMHPAGAHLGLVIMLKAVAVLTWSWVWLLGIDSVAWREIFFLTHILNRAGKLTEIPFLFEFRCNRRIELNIR